LTPKQTTEVITQLLGSVQEMKNKLREQWHSHNIIISHRDIIKLKEIIARRVV